MVIQITSFDCNLVELITRGKNEMEVITDVENGNLQNAMDSSNNTLLHIAAKSNNTYIVLFLLSLDYTHDVQNDVGKTPLMLAIKSESPRNIKMFLLAGFDIEIQDKQGRSALRMIGESDSAATDWILDRFFKILQKICSNDKEKIAKKLCDAAWPLYYVVRLKDALLTKFVLQRGYTAQIDELGKFGETVLHLAIKSVDVETVKVLLEYNANVNILSLDKRTPLSYIYQDGSDSPNEKHEILKMLLTHGANLLSDKPLAVSETYRIFRYANREGVKLLLQSAPVGSENFDRVIAVHVLMTNKIPGVLEELKGMNFNLNACDELDLTPLMIAAFRGNIHAVEFLLREGVDVNAVNYSDSPAIFFAIRQECEKCVQILLEYGADVQLIVKFFNYSTVLELILEKKCFKIGELVIAHLALQQMLEKSLTDITRDQIYSHDQFKIYFESCKKLLIMKIYESITWYDVLNASDKKMKLFARNEELFSKIQGLNALSEYQYYHAILKKKLLKVLLKRAACRIICKIMHTNYELFPFIVDNIVDYLEYKDMEILIDTFNFSIFSTAKKF